MKLLKNLDALHKQEFLKFPVYISLLAASKDCKLDGAEREAVVKLANIKSFDSESLLAEFFKEADKVFENNLSQIERDLPMGKENREVFIKTEILKLEKILLKLGKKYARAMHRSMDTFKDHVSRAHHSIIEDFLLPIPIPGLTD
jgi:hypothetical protein